MSQREYTTFQLDDQLFAVDILCVREINRILEVTPVQQAPSYVLGLSNLRGQVITVFDLSERLGRGSLETPETYNLVLKTNEELAAIRDREKRPELTTVNKDTVSLVVGSIGDVIAVDTNDIFAPPANHSALDAEYLSGVIRHEDKLINLINVPKVLSLEETATASAH